MPTAAADGLLSLGVVAAVAGVLAVAMLVRATLGFGDALLAMPLLTVLVGVRIAAPLVTALSLTVAAMILRGVGRADVTREAIWLLAGALPGVLVGVTLLRAVPEAVLAGVLGATVCLYGLWRMAVLSRLAELWDTPGGDGSGARGAGRFAPLAGFAAGTFGSATGAGGPPLVIYGVARDWSPQRFRATLQVYFLCAGGFAMVGYATAGLWTSASMRLYLVSLPGVLLAVAVGSWLARRVPAARFARLVAVALVLLGASLLAVTLG